jgi:uncharacterized membrane protein
MLPIKWPLRHPRTWIALLVGIAAFLLIPLRQPLISRMLVGWDCGVTFFLVAIYVWMRRFTAEQICSHYIEEDPSAAARLVTITAAALLSLVAIIQPLVSLRHAAYDQRIWGFVLAAITLIDSWLLVPTMFTMHYADMFYSASSENRPLHFPCTKMPAFWDFAYFSFTIAAACQTADVTTTEVSIRRVIILHEIVSFAFNVAIVGFAINITAGLISG